MSWNELRPIERTKKEHRCAATGRLIVIDSKCWKFVGEWDGEFQSWYLSEEAKQFMDDHPELFNDPEGYECQEIGDIMREFKEANTIPMSKNITLRNSVVLFAQHMEERLRANDYKGGWDREPFGYFCTKLHEALHKLTAQRFEHDPDWGEVLKQSANLANYAMMAAEHAKKQLEVSHE